MNNSDNIYLYPYWNPLYVSIKKSNYFSNGDLLFTYYTNIVNLQGDYSDLNLNSTRILVKTDFTTDKTLWAKDIVYMYNGIRLIIVDVDIDNDNVWWMLFAYSNAVYFTIIVKFDVNGNLINSFSAIRNVDQASSVNYYFTPEFLIAYDDWAFIFGETSYSQNLMGSLWRLSIYIWRNFILTKFNGDFSKLSVRCNFNKDRLEQEH